MALATAEGFDARLTYLPDCGQSFFSEHILTPYFLRARNVAINVAGKWRFYDLANRNLPTGMLRWQEEGLPALITDPKEPIFVKTPLTSAVKSKIAKIAEFTLDLEGTLEGEVREILSGQEAITWRSEFESATPAEREENLRKETKIRFADAIITNVNFTFEEDPAKDAGFRYHVKIPGFAQRTGKRLLFAPNYFNAGEPAIFPSGKRDYPIYFKYPWSEWRSIQIKLPKGYELDHGDAPGGINFAPAGEYKIQIGISKDETTLVYQRQFAFGMNGIILIPETNYGALKAIFDAVHEGDGHMLTLKSQSQSIAAKD